MVRWKLDRISLSKDIYVCVFSGFAMASAEKAIPRLAGKAFAFKAQKKLTKINFEAVAEESLGKERAKFTEEAVDVPKATTVVVKKDIDSLQRTSRWLHALSPSATYSFALYVYI